MDQQKDVSPALPGSPRRRKPTLDLDAALYLQSQASYVQEPNTNNSSTTSSLITNNRNLGHCPLAAKCCNSSPSPAPTAAKAGTTNQNPRDGNKFINPYDTLYYNSYNNSNTISVDYIDCVSNTDLLGGAAQNGAQMHNYKKHLRFQRNRVEPSRRRAAAGSETAADSSGQQQPAAHPVTGFGLDADDRDQEDVAPAEQAAAASNNQSVLYPISVSEVKKRSYFIGSLSNDESLLGHDELHRYFPEGKVSIFVCTWNQNRKRAPMNLNDLLLPDQLVYMADIYAIGIQEAFSSQGDYLREWEIELQTTLGPNHVLLHSCSLGVLHLAIFVRRDLIWFCSMPEESVYNSRSMPTNMIKTKGAVSIAFRFFGTSFMFTNCHFPAHEHKLKDRIDEYQRIISSIDLPKNLKQLKPRYLSNDSTARFDCVFFMGDLNFRLEHRSFEETIHILEDIFQNKKPGAGSERLSYEALTQNDELLRVMETDQAFHGFDESQIKFPPTYKFLAQTNKYDRQTKRIPSYTDRILFRSKRQRHIQCVAYDWLPQLLSSDHKPVYCLFEVLVRPGHEHRQTVGSLNAGLFQRTVYLEALKRRAADPEAVRDNGASGSLICSIS